MILISRGKQKNTSPERTSNQSKRYMPPRLVNAHATLWIKAAETAVALLALAATSSSARGVSALQSSVDRDFLRAQFEAHVLQRDWLPQPSSSSLPRHNTRRRRRSTKMPAAATWLMLLLFLPLLQLRAATPRATFLVVLLFLFQNLSKLEPDV
jgi:hypothetical protein